MAPEIKQRPLARRVLRSQSDDRLVKLARQGREFAFDEIVRRYRPGLVAFAHAYAPSDRAEDVVQESLVSSWNALKDSGSDIRLKPWLYAIVRNRALNARRDAKVHQPLDETIDGVRQPGDIALANEELAEVVAAVRGLPEAQREALVKSSLEGHTHEQIAEAIGTSPGGVRQLVFRARTNLRTSLGAVVPLPLVALIASGGAAGAAGGVAAGTAATAGGGSLASTGATVAAVAAIAVGGGVAIERSVGNGDDERATRTVSQARPDDRSGRERTAAPADDPASVARPGSDGDDGGDGRSGGDAGGQDGGASGDSAPVPAPQGDNVADQRDDDRDAAADARDEAEDDERAAAEAAEDAADEAEEAAEEAADAEEEAAEAAEDAAQDEADGDSSGSDSSGSGSDGSGSSNSGSGSSGSGSSGSGSSGSGSSGELDPD